MLEIQQILFGYHQVGKVFLTKIGGLRILCLYLKLFYPPSYQK